MHTGLPHLDTFSELYVYSSDIPLLKACKAFEENLRVCLPIRNQSLLRVPLYLRTVTI